MYEAVTTYSCQDTIAFLKNRSRVGVATLFWKHGAVALLRKCPLGAWGRVAALPKRAAPKQMQTDNLQNLSAWDASMLTLVEEAV